MKYTGKEHVIVLMNHKYDIDWLMSWILAERLQMLGVSIIYIISLVYSSIESHKHLELVRLPVKPKGHGVAIS